MMKRYLAAAAILLGLAGAAPHADAQAVRVVTACGSVSPFPAIHAGTTTGLYVDTTGTLCSVGGGGGGSNASVGPTGSTAPTSATLIGGVTAGGLLQAPIITATQSLKVANSDVESTAGTPSSSNSALTFQGNANGIPAPTSMADGGSVTLGAKADTAWTSGAGSVIALLKAQIGAMSAGVFSTGSPATTPSSAVLVGGDNANGLSIPNPIDPCQEKKSFVDLVTAASGTTKIVTGSSGKKFYLCPGTVGITSVAAHLSIVEGTGTNCGTSTASVYGNNPSSVSAANGLPLAANEAMTPVGSGAFAASATAGDDLCVAVDTATSTNWHLAYVLE